MALKIFQMCAGFGNFRTTRLYVLIIASILTRVSLQYECSTRSCRPPNCLCASTSPPNNMTIEKVPQMVVFTFEDVVTGGKFFNNFEALFAKQGKNPNQCSPAVTFFAPLSPGTDLCVLEKVYSKGHEVAANSVDQRTSRSWWMTAEDDDWTAETRGFREKIRGYLQKEYINGWRTPFLVAGGDIQFSTLSRENFIYDSTLVVDNTTSRGLLPLWPFTLDHGVPLDCNDQMCPKEKYPGMWEVPVQTHMDIEDKECLFLDRCKNAPKNDGQTFQLFWKNFKNSYGSNRAPIIFNLKLSWLKGSNAAEGGFKSFVKELNKMEDVYIVSMIQMIEWLRNPTPLDKIGNFEPWKCHFRWKVTCEFQVKDTILNKYWWLEIPILTIIFLILWARDRDCSY